MLEFIRRLFGWGTRPRSAIAREFPPDAPPDVVISYCRRDASFAEPLIVHLRAQGINVWWDRELYPGEDLHDAILAALDAAKAVIVIWSDRAVASLWVRDEARRAAKKNKLITACVPGFDLEKIPLGFGERQCDSIDDPARLIRALGRYGVTPQATRTLAALAEGSPA
jgi:hypothetical protein